MLNKVEKYEELYRQFWESQTKKDKLMNPRLETKNPYAKNGAKTKTAPKMLKLTKDAEMLNKLLKKELSLSDAADIMNLSLNSLRQIKSVYKLPRTVE